MKMHPFSLRARRNSFAVALQGLLRFFREEPNASIHLLLTAGVAAAAVFFQVSWQEAVALLFAGGMVWAAELFNTAIEKAMNFISTERNDAIKYVKDLAASAVLVSAIVAAITGAIVFIPKICGS